MYPRIEYSSDFKKDNVIHEPTMDDIENFVDVLTENATIQIKKRPEGYIIDVWDLEGELVNTFQVWNDELTGDDNV